MEQFTIGEIALRAGIRTSAIRYYESVGLLPAARRVSGQRRYGEEVLTQLTLVQMAQEAGFRIDEIRTLLSGFPEETPSAMRWQDLAQRKLLEVDALIARMQTVRQVLEQSLQCDCLTLDACAVHGWAGGTTMPARAIVAGASNRDPARGVGERVSDLAEERSPSQGR